MFLHSAHLKIIRQIITNLKSKIQNHQSIIGVIGLGYVGLPLVIRFSEEGFRVMGFDIDKEKVDLLNDGKSYIKHIKEVDISAMTNIGFTATTDFIEILKFFKKFESETKFKVKISVHPRSRTKHLEEYLKVN